MKYYNKTRKPLGLDRQLEELAFKHMNKYYTNITREKFEANKQYYIKEYFRDCPKMEVKYNKVKGNRRTLAGIVTGIMIGATVATGILTYTNNSNATTEHKQSNAIESTMERESETEEDKKIVNIKISSEKENTEYENILEEVEKLKSGTSIEPGSINYHRKQVIVEAYNKANSDNPITPERLGIIVSKPDFLIVKKDKLGNIVETRMKSTINKEQGEEQIEGREVYQYYIDKKLVAVYDKLGTKIADSRVKETDDNFWLSTVAVVDLSEKLKESYWREDPEVYLDRAKEQYAKEVINYKEKTEKSIENNKTKDETEQYK